MKSSPFCDYDDSEIIDDLEFKSQFAQINNQLRKEIKGKNIGDKVTQLIKEFE